MPEFGSYAQGTPCWVDVTTSDIERTNAFYGSLFGWRADEVPNGGGYTMYMLDGKYVAAGSPPPPGSEGIPPHWTTYLASDDADATAVKIREAGGTVLVEPFDVFDSGRMAIAADPTGASFGVWQAREHVGAQLASEPGTLLWNQCQTGEPARATEFYRAVFGYEVDEVAMGEGEPFRVLKVEGRGVGGVRSHIDAMGRQPHWSTVFAVADADETVAQASRLGAAVVLEPLDLPAIGRVAVLTDPVGASFQVMATELEP